MNDGGTTVGLVGADDASAAFAEAVADAGGEVLEGPTEDVLDGEPAVVVAVGESRFVDVTTAAPDVPVLPVDAGRGVRSVSREDLPASAGNLIAEDWDVESHPLLSVAVDGEHVGTAVTDLALATAEAAHISEYDLTAGQHRLDCVRADGVVVATPAGSTGYARRLDAPILAPGTGAVVVPIAPFATDPDHWVVDPDGLRFELARDEAPVELVVDDAVAGSVDPSETVTVGVDAAVECVVLPASPSRYG